LKSVFKNYRQFATTSGDFQRGAFRHKEFHGIAYKDGTMDRAPASVREAHKVKILHADPNKEIALQYHTHWGKPGNEYWVPRADGWEDGYRVSRGPTGDDFKSAFGPLSIVITRTEAFSYTNSIFTPFLQPAYYFTRYNTGSILFKYY
jgi:hypothetical protein